jgi:hypothetical protein
LHQFLWEDLQPAGTALGLEFRLFMVSGFDKLPSTYATIKRDGFDAVTLLTDAQFYSERRRLGELALEHRLPSVNEVPLLTPGGYALELRSGSGALLASHPKVDTLHVMSGYRTPFYNRAIGDVP